MRFRVAIQATWLQLIASRKQDKTNIESADKSNYVTLRNKTHASLLYSISVKY